MERRSRTISVVAADPDTPREKRLTKRDGVNLISARPFDSAYRTHHSLIRCQDRDELRTHFEYLERPRWYLNLARDLHETKSPAHRHGNGCLDVHRTARRNES